MRKILAGCGFGAGGRATSERAASGRAASERRWRGRAYADGGERAAARAAVARAAVARAGVRRRRRGAARAVWLGPAGAAQAVTVTTLEASIAPSLMRATSKISRARLAAGMPAMTPS